jgi:hypothetical protein
MADYSVRDEFLSRRRPENAGLLHLATHKPSLFV